MAYDLIRYLATKHEALLLEDFDDLGYGEIYQVEHRSDNETVEVEVTQKIKNFFVALRTIGHAQKVIVHDGEPTMIEYRGRTPSGHRCLKKMKM